jgi:hypothetical protein
MDAQTFHDTIVKEFNLQAYPPEEQQQYIDQLGELVLQGVLMKSFSAISDEQSEQMEQALGQGMAPEQMMAMLQEMIPGFNELIMDEVAQIKTDLANGTGTSTADMLADETSSSSANTGQSDSIFG